MGAKKFDFSHLTKKQKENVRKWVKALESGKYLQVTSHLEDKRHDGKIGYCCLGVANKIFEMGNDVTGGYLNHPEEVLGISPPFEDEDEDNVCFQNYLIGLNDNGHRNFKYIAKRIRQHMLGEKVA